MLGWCLNLAYAGLLLAASPLVLWRALRHGRYRRGWRERLLGDLPPRATSGAPHIWLHAVSVGEVILLQPLVRRLASARPEARLLVTTSTDAGYDVAREKLPGCDVHWCPLDFTWAVRRALRRVRPELLVLVELELWPNLIRAARSAGVPVALVNARMSLRSYRGYSRIRRWMAPLLQSMELIAAQTDEYAERLIALGAEPARTIVTGSMKFDGVQTDRAAPAVQTLRRLLGLQEGEPVFMAGSTQAPEEVAALDAWQAARAQFPNLRLVLVPRHRERFDEVAQLVRSRNLPLLRRSETTAVECAAAADAGVSPVILLDTMGELATAWGVADIAYVGGSLTPGRGGQNLLEPAAYGAAVVCGRHTENFRAIVELLRSASALIEVDSGADLTRTLRRLLSETATRTSLGPRARAAVLSHQGAADRTLAALLAILPAKSTSLRKAA